MKNIIDRIRTIYILDIIIIIIGAYNLFLLTSKAILPENLNDEQITKINEFNINPFNSIETVLDLYVSGDLVRIEIIKNGESIHKEVILESYYNVGFIIITVFSTIFFVFPAIFILQKCEDSKVADAFHFLMMSVVIMLMFTFGSLRVGFELLNVLVRTIDQLSYLTIGIAFLHFTLLFPIKKLDRAIRSIKYIYLLVIVIAIPLFVLNYYYVYSPTQNIINIYDIIHYHIIKPFFIPIFVVVFINVIYSYYSSKDSSNKVRSIWIILSIIWGPSIYIVLYLIPGLIFDKSAVSESIMQILIVLSPISLFIGIYKYKLFDIRMIIKRSFVYAFIFSLILITYILLFVLFDEYLKLDSNSSKISGVITIILTVTLYQPIKNISQNFVNKNFFRIEYDYQKTKEIITQEIKKSLTINQLDDLSCEFFVKYFKIANFSNFYYDRELDDLILISGQNNSYNQSSLYILKEFLLNNRSHNLIANEYLFSDDISFTKNSELLGLLSCDLIICNYNDEKSPVCITLISNNSTDRTFISDDIALINLFLVQLGEQIHKINTQKKILFQDEEIKKLGELNQIKNYFISNVSHELKTPITSISLFSEIMLTNQNIEKANREEYLKIIQSECHRLTRMINNILDFSKIERGTKEYNFSEVDINSIIDLVVKSMFYILKMKKFNLIYERNNLEYMIYGDSDVLMEVFYNLIDNSIKYSTNNKEISINTYQEHGNYVCEISDKGIGIDLEHQKSIFTPYYRIKNNETSGVAGTGLGMSIVSNIIKAHKGKILLNSKVNEGTNIKIILPRVK